MSFFVHPFLVRLLLHAEVLQAPPFSVPLTLALVPVPVACLSGALVPARRQWATCLADRVPALRV